MPRHRLPALAAALALTVGAAACGSDDGADVRNLEEEEDGSSSSGDSSGSSSATEAEE